MCSSKHCNNCIDVLDDSNIFTCVTCNKDYCDTCVTESPHNRALYECTSCIMRGDKKSYKILAIITDTYTGRDRSLDKIIIADDEEELQDYLKEYNNLYHGNVYKIKRQIKIRNGIHHIL